MDIERAKKIANKLNWSHFDMSEDSSKEYTDAVQTVLSELEKKDIIINYLIDDLYDLAVAINEEYHVEEFLLNKETIKEYYLNRKEE